MKKKFIVISCLSLAYSREGNIITINKYFLCCRLSEVFLGDAVKHPRETYNLVMCENRIVRD